MSDAPLTDRILDLIDNGLQSSYEHACDAGRSELCARCQRHEPAEGGEMCAGCRGFLLEDSDVDPKTELEDICQSTSYSDFCDRFGDLMRNRTLRGETDETESLIIIDDLNNPPADAFAELNRAALREQMRSYWEARAERAEFDGRMEARERNLRAQLIADARISSMRDDPPGFTHITAT